ncbi:ribonuclease III [Candidatus Microgenomates bacterium]|nr:ribonuclease III [Candidatus Microgenomates bacterium]
MKNKRNEKTVEKKLGIIFKNPKLLHTALVHRSYLNESQEPQSNERFEFLGDAVLEFVVSANLTVSFPDLQEGELTALRARLVNTESLASVATKLNLGDVLYLSRGEERGGGRKNTALLADTFEAIMGALFLDQGIEACEKVVAHLILPSAQQELAHLKDPKSLLQELVQAQGKRAPFYKVIHEEGPDHAKMFTIAVLVENQEIAKGAGKSKKEAEEEAAKAALERLKE